MRRVVAAVALALAVPLVAGCGSSTDDYCEAVADHQTDLGETLGQGTPQALLEALDVLRDLQDSAPDDITEEWAQVVDSLEGLREALDDAGLDPATYDRSHPPAGLTAAQKAAIDDAAATVGSGETVSALAALEQQARDVCHTPLTL